MVQGALSSVKALAQGVGPLIYSGLFSLFSHKDGKLPYFPGESSMLAKAIHAEEVICWPGAAWSHVGT